MRLFIVGASGNLGRELTSQAVGRGHEVTAQTRDASKVQASDRIGVAVGEPTDEAFLARILPAHDAVAFALGVDHSRATTLFSEATRALVAAMKAAGVPRLVAVTGVGAGETRGHGGFLYDRIVYPLFTRHQYADKDRQERITEASGLDWTIVRPAPFSRAPASAPLETLTRIGPADRLTRVSIPEVATFLLDELDTPRLVGRKPFVGHRR